MSPERLFRALFLLPLMLNKLNKICVMLLLPVFFSPAGDAFAQVWHQQRNNELFNTRSGSASPSAIYSNPTSDWHSVIAGWNYENGAFHRPDAPSGKSEMDIGVEELQSVGRFRTAGSIRYRNTREFDRNWNSLIGNDPDNPYVICDSLSDRSVTELFDIHGALSWSFGSGWVVGGSVALKTGTLSDIRDPRPRNDISRIPVSFGIERPVGDIWTLGVFGGAELFRSDFRYYLEDGQKVYRYYKMKGMGDFFAFSSSDSSTAPREYSGITWTGGINALADYGQTVNFVEILFDSGKEDARDGGSSYEWKAGDYSHMQFKLTDRLDIKKQLVHSISLTADFKMREGYWYDQKRSVDTEHGNMTYFEVKSRYLNNEAFRLRAGGSYRVSSPDSWSAVLNAGFCMENDTHYTDGDPHVQSWNLLELSASGWKTFLIGKHILDISAGAGYVLPLGEPSYDSGNSAPAKEDISEWYVAPAFAYETSARISAFIRADWVMPASHGGKLRPGLFAKGSILRQTGAALQSPSLEGTDYCAMSAGAFLNF